MTTEISKMLGLPRKLQLILWKRLKIIAPATQNDFRHVTKHVWMSRSATPATPNEATRHLKPPKVTPFAELTLGTAKATSRGRLWTAADGCERLRTIANSCGRLGDVERTHPLPPDPQWNGNPCYAFGEKAFTQRSFYTQKLVRKETFTHRNF